MASKLILTYRDYSEPGETGTAVFRGADITAANFAAQETLMNALRAGVANIVLGTLKKETRVAVEDESPGALPASPYAQRETKWLVRYSDNVTGEPFKLEIPCAELTFLDPTQKDKADLGGTEMAAFVAAFEAYVRTEAGNQVTVLEVRHVGRRT